MYPAKEEATRLHAQQHPDCFECLSRLDPPEVYTVTRFRDNVVLAWDVELAVEICMDGRPAVQLPSQILDAVLQVNATTLEHLDHVDPTVPGIACAVDHSPDGEAIIGVIDGSHRAARCRRDGLPFFVYLLTEQESRQCQLTAQARLCAFLESLLRHSPSN